MMSSISLAVWVYDLPGTASVFAESEQFSTPCTRVPSRREPQSIAEQEDVHTGGQQYDILPYGQLSVVDDIGLSFPVSDV